MKYIINDTNIWIDLKYADLLDIARIARKSTDKN